MPSIEARTFASPDETRTPDRTRLDVIRMGATSSVALTISRSGKSEEAAIVNCAQVRSSTAMRCLPLARP